MSLEFRISPLTLVFCDTATERSFREYDFLRMRRQARAAICVGMAVYLLYGILDLWFVPAAARTAVWSIRLSALLVPTAVIALTFHPNFRRINYGPLALVGLAAGIGLIGMLWQIPVETAVYYYVGLVLATFYTYNFIGTRFVYAFFVDIGLLIAYNLIFGLLRDYPLPIMINHDFFIISANLIGGFSGYMAEQHRRELFIHKKMLEQERHFHQQRALHDPLTDLPNRELLFDRLERAILNAQRTRQLAVGLFIDLNDFKCINDYEGHACGDWVLKEVARRLSVTLRESDTVSRLSGDEFFILATEIDDQDAINALTRKIVSCITSPMSPPGLNRSLSVGASIGTCVFPFPECTPASIIERADQAMYREKRHSKSRQNGKSLADVSATNS